MAIKNALYLVFIGKRLQITGNRRFYGNIASNGGKEQSKYYAKNEGVEHCSIA
ncbi:MAG: hypothetical protein ACI9Y1_001641 [Lentisphaeria bacterium]